MPSGSVCAVADVSELRTPWEYRASFSQDTTEYRGALQEKRLNASVRARLTICSERRKS
jgi:hypothetical protein